MQYAEIMNQDIVYANGMAAILTEEIRVKAPGYSVQWNPAVKGWDDEPYGMFEVIGTGKKVHYRRRNADGVRKLIHG